MPTRGLYWSHCVKSFASLANLPREGLGCSGRQLQLILLFVEMREIRGIPPTQAEMARALECSKVTVLQRVVAMAEKKIISRRPRSPRSIKLHPKWRAMINAVIAKHGPRLFTRCFGMDWESNLAGNGKKTIHRDKDVVRIPEDRGDAAEAIRRDIEELLRSGPGELRADAEELLRVIKSLKPVRNPEVEHVGPLPEQHRGTTSAARRERPRPR